MLHQALLLSGHSRSKANLPAEGISALDPLETFSPMHTPTYLTTATYATVTTSPHHPAAGQIGSLLCAYYKTRCVFTAAKQELKYILVSGVDINPSCCRIPREITVKKGKDEFSLILMSVPAISPVSRPPEGCPSPLWLHHLTSFLYTCKILSKHQALQLEMP